MELKTISSSNGVLKPTAPSQSDFHSTFLEWAMKCGDYSTKSGDTFVDESGVLRYANNWQEVDGEIGSSRADVLVSGLIKVPVRLSAKDSKACFLSFLMDFRTMWKYMSKDDVDEVASYSPLFRLYIEVVFHRRTAQLMIYLTLHYFVAVIIANVSYPVLDPFVQFIYYLYVLVGGAVYLALAILFKGSHIFDVGSAPTPDSAAEQSRGLNKRDIHRNPSVSWTIRLRDAIQATLSEVAAMWRGEDSDGGTVSDLAAHSHPVPFYEALNIGLKFLSKRKISGNQRLQLNTRKNNAKLIFIFVLVPVYSVLWNFVSVNGLYNSYQEECRVFGRDSEICKNFTLMMILTIGNVVPVLQKTIFTCGVLLSLVGLHFGAEVGRGLVDSWINRFGMLRRLDAQDVNLAAGLDVGTSASSETAAGGKAKSIKFSTVTSALHEGNITTQSTAESLPHTSPTGLAPQQVPSHTPDADADKFKELLPYLQRDAYEHYLFIREFMDIGSRAWSPIIITLSFFATYCILLFTYGAIAVGSVLTTVDWVYYSIWICIRVGLLIIYPIVSLAHTNAYVYALHEQFLVAAPEDFAVIGGRDSWLSFLEKVPAIWTIYGFWITWDRLTGLLWTAVAGLGALAITYASNTVK